MRKERNMEDRTQAEAWTENGRNAGESKAGESKAGESKAGESKAGESEAGERKTGGRKVGILGGTFDPIHTAHLIIAEAAYDAFELDEVLLMPSGHSYLKDDRAQKVLPPEVRYTIVCEAAADNPHLTASDFETYRSGNTYTCDTILELRALYPKNHYYFIVGGDTIHTILSWRSPEVVFANCTILAAVREDSVPTGEFLREIENLRTEYGADIHTLEIPSLGISSTDIRNRIKNGRTIRYLVPDRVERYIMENGLYR